MTSLEQDLNRKQHGIEDQRRIIKGLREEVQTANSRADQHFAHWQELIDKIPGWIKEAMKFGFSHDGGGVENSNWKEAFDLIYPALDAKFGRRNVEAPTGNTRYYVAANGKPTPDRRKVNAKADRRSKPYDCAYPGGKRSARCGLRKTDKPLPRKKIESPTFRAPEGPIMQWWRTCQPKQMTRIFIAPEAPKSVPFHYVSPFSSRPFPLSKSEQAIHALRDLKKFGDLETGGAWEKAVDYAIEQIAKQN